jgi:hypothetical protein
VGEQILLFRIELDPAVASVYQHLLVPRNFFISDPENLSTNYKNESNGETTMLDCFADDGNVTTILDRDNIARLRSILDAFGIMSGLTCNYGKSFILSTANDIDPHIKADIEQIGFPIKNSIKLLGFELTCNGIDANLYADSLLEKMRRIVLFWQRYRLSLQGRINVFKTLLLAQISYGGCILDLGIEKINELQALCNNFVLGTLSVSRDRLYSDTSSGGIGLIKIEDFLVAQQAMWVGKVFRSTRDCWGVDLHSATLGNPLTLNKDDRCLQNFRALKPIIKSFDTFRKKFYENVTSNSDIYIFNNTQIKRSCNEAAFLDTEFFSRNIPALNMELVAKLKVKDFFREGIFKSRDELVNDTNCNFNLVTYFRLRSALLQYNNVYRGGLQQYFYLTGLDEFFLRVTKGSKALRRILSYEKLLDDRVLRLTTVKTYFGLAESDIPLIKDLRLLLSTWKKNYVSRDLSDLLSNYLITVWD